MIYRVTLALTLVATPALADLTAEEVLADQLNLLSGYGLMEIEAKGQTATASGLTVESFVATHIGETETVTLTIGGADLVEQADGSVRVIYPASLPVSLKVEQADGDVVTTLTALELTDPVHRVSGDATAMRHEFSATALAINEMTVDPVEELEMVDFSFAYALQGLAGQIDLDRGPTEKRDIAVDFDQMKLVTYFRVPEEAAPEGSDRQPGTFDADITMNGISAGIGYEGTEVPRHSLSMTLADIDWTQLIDVPEDDTHVNLSLTGTDFAMDYDVNLSIEDLEEDYVDAIRSGQGFSGSFAAGAVAYDFDVETPDGPVKVEVSAGSTRADLGLSSAGARYTGGVSDLSAMMSGQIPDFPLPGFGYTMEAADFVIAVPLLPSDEPQTFALKYLLKGLAVPGDLWSLFDPAGQIPRDPLDFELDLKGTTVIAEDLFRTYADVPFSQTEARLNALRLSMAGVSLDGKGEIRDLSTPDAPKGEGTLNFTLTGANALLDTLVTMGLLPEEQAMGARMGLALIARPSGDDVLTSTIELTEDGSVIANGQRIK